MLIIGGAGGVGSIGIQIAQARRPAGSSPPPRARRPIAWVEELGADQVVDHRENRSPPRSKKLGRRSTTSPTSTTTRRPLAGAWRELIAPQGAIVRDRRQPRSRCRWTWCARRASTDLLGADVHAAALQDAGHDRAARAAQPGRRLARRRQAARHDARRRSRRSTPQTCARRTQRLESGTMIGKLVLKGW